MPPTLSKETSREEQSAGIMQSHGLSIDVPGAGANVRPPNIKHSSLPAYESPLRHHRREPSTPRRVKETLHARSEYSNDHDDGAAVHRINQYYIKEEIGRGSFGAVHLAVDVDGNEYAVKEFSKSRLRKRAQSNLLRRPYQKRQPGRIATGVGFNAPLHRHPSSEIHDNEEEGNPLYLIKEEIAVMKKLNHSNLVSLIEVLDDPDEDSLYMVLEMCKKGVIMKVGLGDKADPYDIESCRCWFRDLILGIEYLHAQGVVHRDIKPDNLLLTEDDVLKIVDFGVSEMFEKQSEMLTAKSAGSPAFLPPELCVAKHGGISGKAADIWSMGVTLYCLRFGQIPFEKPGILETFESIKNDPLEFEGEVEGDFKDLMLRLLEKDPSKRIKMPELREHPWVTNRGTDPLLSEEENTAELVEPPTEEEMNSAITGNLSNLLVVMRAVKKFKNLIMRKRPYLMDGIFGRDTRLVQLPLSISKPDPAHVHHRTRSVDILDRRPLEGALVVEGVHRDIDPSGADKNVLSIGGAAVAYEPTRKRSESAEEPKGHGQPSPKRTLNAHPSEHGPSGGHQGGVKDSGKGHARDPLEEYLFLEIGPHGEDNPPQPPAVSESPPAAGIDIYATAYHEEIERIREKQGKQATLYLTRRVEKNQSYQQDENLIGSPQDDSTPKSGFAKMIELAREKEKCEPAETGEEAPEGEGDDGGEDDRRRGEAKRGAKRGLP